MGCTWKVIRQCECESQSCPTLWPHGQCSLWISPGKNTGVGSLSLLQGIFPTQGSNPGLPQCRRIFTSWASSRSISKGPPLPCPLGTGFPLEERPPGGLFFLTELLISRAEGAMYLIGKLGERTRQTNPVSSWVPLISELVVQVPLLPSREDRRTCAWRWNHATQTGI